MAKHILIVDDSATMRKSIVRGLRQAGIGHAEFMQAASGTEALALVANGHVDLVLSDVDMPHMNGLEFVTAVHAQVPTPPPIVMLTTEGSEEVAKEALARGASGCLQKPLTAAKIQEVLGPFVK